MSVATAGAARPVAPAQRRLALVFALTAGLALGEAAVGVLSGSLALQADAAHVFADVLALGLAFASAWMARRPPTHRATYGYYRLEILAALANALLLLLVAAYIGFEAWQRLAEPRTVPGLPMLAVALVGLAVNLAGIALLTDGGSHRENLNLRAAALELFGDALGSVGVLAAALVTILTGWPLADPLFAVLVTLLIVPRTLSLLRAAVGVLLEASPRRIDVAEVERALAEVPGVSRVHDLHVWTIGSGFDAMSGHAEVESSRCAEALAQMRAILRDRFGIQHATIQVEESPADLACSPGGCRAP